MTLALTMLGVCVTGVLAAGGIMAGLAVRDARRQLTVRSFRRQLRHARAGDATRCLRCGQPPEWGASMLPCACEDWCGAGGCLAIVGEDHE